MLKGETVETKIRKKLLLCLSLVLMILVSGCLTMSFDSKVNKNGEIEKYDVKLKTTALVYSTMNNMCQNQNGISLKESLKSECKNYNEVWDENNVTIILNGENPKNVTVEKSENYLIYKDRLGYLDNSEKNSAESDDSLEKTFGSPVQINYYLEMPNKIIDSNADYVEGNKAEWHMLNSTSIRDVYAKCEAPSSLPGIGGITSVSVLLITSFVFKRKK